jgi:hypothetical protein
MRCVLVDCKSVEKVNSVLFVLVHLRSYFNVGKIKCNSFLNYSWDCKRKGDEAEGKLGKDGMITKLEQDLPAYSSRPN